MEIEWISVNVRLPEENKVVLCARTLTSMSGTNRIISAVGSLRKNGSKFTCEMDWINVDYWADFPAPPPL